MIIDSHIHIGQWSEIFLNYSSTVDEAVKIMKEAGVDKAVCMPTDATPNAKLLNEVKNKEDFKFHFCAWINPEDKELDNFLDQNLNEVSAFKIHPSIQRKRITDESYEKYLSLAEENSKPVIVHCGRWQDIASYKFPLECKNKFPGLKLILAHMGGDLPAVVIECANEIKNYRDVYLGTESIREFYFVNEAVRIAGAERVIFGSDYNLGLPQSYIPIVESLNISSEEKEMIFSGNILKLLTRT